MPKRNKKNWKKKWEDKGWQFYRFESGNTTEFKLRSPTTAFSIWVSKGSLHVKFKNPN